jgi:putative transposase
VSFYALPDKAVLRRPLELGQYTSIEFTQTLTDHRVLRSIGSVGDAYDNAMAESFVDSFKTELITDRVWVSLQALELAIVE